MPRYPRKSRVFKPHVRVPAPKRLRRSRLRPPRHYMGRELDREVRDISVGEIEESLNQERKQLDAARQVEGVEETAESPPTSEPELSEEAIIQTEPAILDLGSAEDVSGIVETQELEGVELPESSLAVEAVETGEVEQPSGVHLALEETDVPEPAPVEPPSLEDVNTGIALVSQPEIEELEETKFAQAELPDIEEPASVQVDTEDYAYASEEPRVEPLDLDYAVAFEGVQPLELDEAVSEPAQISDVVDLHELAGEPQFAAVAPEEFEVSDIELPRSDPDELLQYAESGRIRSPTERFQNFQPKNFISIPDIA